MSLTQINKAGLDELALDHVFTIGASGSSAYTFQGEGLNGTVNNPTLYLTRGKTYRFENGSGGHPIRIQSTSGASGTAYSTGVTNNAGSGTVIVEVQHDAPDVLYYQCTSHAAMNGILYITGALADGGVTTAKIADDGVTTAKIAADAVTGAKIADDAINSEHYTDGSIDTAHIADSQVTNAKLADNAVSTAKIVDDAVTGDKINANAVSTSHIADNSITSAKIANEAVTLAKLPHGTSSNDGKFLRANNGADPTFETVSAGPTIANQGDNRVITATGTTDALNAESGVTIDSSNILTIQGSGQQQMTIGSTNGGIAAIILDGNSNGDGAGGDYSLIRHNSSGELEFYARDPSGAANYIFRTGSTEKIRFQASGGISFNGDSAGANALDDYEEGTWTPTLEAHTGYTQPTQSYGHQMGYYTKIGNFVMIQIDVAMASSGVSGGSGDAVLKSLPFTCANQTQAYGVTCAVGYSPSWGSITPTSGYVQPNDTYMNLMGIDRTTGTSFVQANQIGNGTRFIVGFSYRTNS